MEFQRIFIQKIWFDDFIFFCSALFSEAFPSLFFIFIFFVFSQYAGWFICKVTDVPAGLLLSTVSLSKSVFSHMKSAVCHVFFYHQRDFKLMKKNKCEKVSFVLYLWIRKTEFITCAVLLWLHSLKSYEFSSQMRVEDISDALDPGFKVII